MSGCRHTPRVWLFGGIGNSGAGTGGVYTGQRSRHCRHDQEHRAHSTWRAGSFVEMETSTKPACRTFRSTSFVATKSGTIAAGAAGAAGAVPGDNSTAPPASPTSAVDGDAAASAGRPGGVDDNNPNSPSPAVANTASLRSLRTARDRGDVKYKMRKEKPVKGEPPSDSAGGSGNSSSNSIAASRSGPKLLRLSKLLADRAIGTRSEVGILDVFLSQEPFLGRHVAAGGSSGRTNGNRPAT